MEESTNFIQLPATELKKLTKDKVIEYVLRIHTHNEFIENKILSSLESNKEEIRQLNKSVHLVLEENKKLKKDLAAALENNEKLSSRIAVSENASEKLQISLEKLIFANSQYSRRECIEIAGIPTENPKDFKMNTKEGQEITDFKKMQVVEEKKCLKVFQLMNGEVKSADLHACHRLKNGNLIVKFISRKKCQEVFIKRHLLYNVDVSDITKDPNKHIWVNDSLCPHYKMIFYHSRNLQKKKLIEKTWISNGTILIKRHNTVDKILHIHDLKVRFPDVKFE